MADRRGRHLISSSLRPLAPLAAVWLVGILVLVAVVAQRDIPYEDLLLDPATTSKLPWYTGLISNLGVLGWATATTIAGAGGWLAHHGRRRGAARFLGGGAAFSLLLLLDDLFQLHIVVSRYLGMPKSAFYGLYVVMGAAWLAPNWPEVQRTRWPLLAAALAALSLSVAVDQLAPGSDVALVGEDSFKFLGILAWSVYFCTSTADISRSILEPLSDRLAAAGSSPGVGPGPSAQVIEDTKEEVDV